MSNAPEGRGLATDDFDDDEIDWNDESGRDQGLSPLESLADEGSDVFDREDDHQDSDDSN